jgi:hypothetical protein
MVCTPKYKTNLASSAKGTNAFIELGNLEQIKQ